MVYRLWYAPCGALKKLRDEGAVNLGLARLGRAAMERAAWHLGPVVTPTADAPEVYYLTGHRFAYQTAFCAVSLVRKIGRPIRVVAIDDGTLCQTDLALLRHALPALRIVSVAEVESTLEARLPIARYPELRRRRLVYPHLRKLTDIHAGGGGWKLVLDSDMLFHGFPKFLLDWIAAPDRPCHMVDVDDAYGYSARLLRELAGVALPAKVNVGVCGLASDQIDWDRLEYWSRVLVEREGTHYLMEQALVAMLVAGKTCAVAPAKDYIVAPSRRESESPTGVLHHYTAQAKAWYFRFGWRHISEQANASAA